MAIGLPDYSNGPPEDRQHVASDRNVIGPTRGTGRTDIFFAAVQMSRMPMVLSDPHLADNPVIFCNRAFEQLTGYTREEIIGRNCRFLQGKNTDLAAIEEIRRALRAQEDTHLELINYRKDGSTFWNSLYLSPVIDTDGKLIYHFASQLDVTRRRETEAAMLQTERLDTLGFMASSLAHEFNNLMTVVLVNLERLETEMSFERRAKNLTGAIKGAQRAVKLTNQLLSFARRDTINVRYVDVNQTLLECDAILDQVGGSDTKVRLELADKPMLALIDPGQTAMAIVNLVKNAADASISRDEIVISTRQRPYDGPESAVAVEIAITDYGKGMSADVAARAVEPFYTTKASGQGTGLGLSIVKRFVEQSNGKLELKTAPNAGTTVRLVFPMMAEPNPE